MKKTEGRKSCDMVPLMFWLAATVSWLQCIFILEVLLRNYSILLRTMSLKDFTADQNNAQITEFCVQYVRYRTCAGILSCHTLVWNLGVVTKHSSTGTVQKVKVGQHKLFMQKPRRVHNRQKMLLGDMWIRETWKHTIQRKLQLYPIVSEKKVSKHYFHIVKI
jgi:hypothetical protein